MKMERLTDRDFRIGLDDSDRLPGYAPIYEKLREYEDMEEQGKLLKLPCAVGDTVYVLRIDNLAYMMDDKKVWEIVEGKFKIRHFDCIGKTVFLTREEAESALKELSEK